MPMCAPTSTYTRPWAVPEDGLGEFGFVVALAVEVALDVVAQVEPPVKP